MTLFLTATSRFEDRDEDTKQHMLLVHSVIPFRTEWRSICGYDFLSYEVHRPPRTVTCVWCIAGMKRSMR